MIRTAAIALIGTGLALSLFGAGPGDDDAEITRLRDEVARLGAIVRGTVQPVNLARTTLATVDASSVNGSRALNNRYYGVLNAFDDGNNWLDNGINYTYWLTSGEPSPWIEVYFDHPVTVTSIVTEEAPPFTTRLRFAEGGERDLAITSGQVDLVEPAHGVASLRLTFAGAANVKVHEVRVLGHVAPSIGWEPAPPRIRLTKKSAEAIAAEAYAAWRNALHDGVTHALREDDGCFVVNYRKDGIDLLRVTIRERDLEVRTTPLAAWSAIAGTQGLRPATECRQPPRFDPLPTRCPEPPRRRVEAGASGDS